MIKTKHSLNGKIALVTGGDRGIGKATVQEFSDQGVKVAFTYHERKSIALAFEEELMENGRDVMALQLDLSSRKSIQSVIAKVQDEWSSVSILVNNAAVAQEKPFALLTDEDWDRLMVANLRGPFAAIQTVLPEMVLKKWGRIINISSIGGQWGGFNQVHYAAAKAGLINLTRSVAKIYSKDGITCNAVAPGLVSTDMIQKELKTEEGKNKVNNIPLGRIATPQEVASIILFLASEDASYITGQTINANGGMYFS
jgi:acetoacetyl-CoA reductase/3-oxoacyl-[acyl-carrier protein] reductase